MAKAVKYSLLYAVLMFCVHPLYFVMIGDAHQIFNDVVVPACTVIMLLLYPVFRVKLSGNAFFSLFAFIFCAALGVPTFVAVGINCNAFNFGTALAYVIYGYLLCIAMVIICALDGLVTLSLSTVKKIKKRG